MRGRLIWFSVWSGVLASCLYGIVHDQITIRICPDYFLVWHPQLLSTDNTTLVALAWGVMVTWWMGAFLGLLVGLGAAAGKPPFASKRQVVKTFIWVMVATTLCAAAVGIAVWNTDMVAPSFVEGFEIAGTSPDNRHRFMVDWAIHNTSYNAGALAGLVGAVCISIGRYRRGKPNPVP
jgi:hypothetical protein